MNTETYSLYRDETLTDQQKDLVLQIHNAADSLRYSLDRAQKSAAESLARMAAGQTAAWGSTIFGSEVRDAEEANTRLATLIRVAVLMEIPQTVIEHVYTNGAF